tara:strand:+ start:175 stop:384 length:210 start_codon:yes stop_codon:yes gene_type:complete
MEESQSKMKRFVRTWKHMTNRKMKQRLSKLIEQIEEHVLTCCAVTMEPDEVLELIDRLKELIKDVKDDK